LDEGRERVFERPCLEYWLGVAEGRGIRVYLDKSCGELLSHPFFYGVDYWEEKTWVENELQTLLPSIARDGYRGSR
jgi:hypothetical protein